MPRSYGLETGFLLFAKQMQSTCKLDANPHLLCIVSSAAFCSRVGLCVPTKVSEVAPGTPGQDFLSVGGSAPWGGGNDRMKRQPGSPLLREPGFNICSAKRFVQEASLGSSHALCPDPWPQPGIPHF